MKRLMTQCILVVLVQVPFAIAADGDNYNIQVPGEIQAPKGQWQTPGEIKAPKGQWQTPGEIKTPKGTWQVPKDFKSPIVVRNSGCKHRLEIGSDVLFEFNKSTINKNAETALAVLGSMVQKYGKHPIQVEGHTDAVGSDTYNQSLSERRAEAVKQWLISRQFIDSAAQTVGFGKRKPVAPNTLPDGTDNPTGRQKNRRVEIVIDSCK